MLRPCTCCLRRAASQPLPAAARPLPARSADPSLAAELGEPLQAALDFFFAARDAYGPLLVAALREATG